MESTNLTVLWKQLLDQASSTDIEVVKTRAFLQQSLARADISGDISESVSNEFLSSALNMCSLDARI